MKPDTTLVISLAGRPGSFGFTVHNAGYDALNLNYFYKPMVCTDLGAALRGVRSLGIRGVGLTMPHKVNALQYLDEITPRAEATGAVNTVINDDGKLIGHNTDVIGALELLKDYAHLPWLVLGAGGMARAFLQAGREISHKNMVLSCRDAVQGRGIAALFGAAFLPWDQRDKMVGCALLNATPIGMKPDDAQSPVEAAAVGHFGLVFDAVPDPVETKLIAAARATNVKVITGRDLALTQAFAQFELYTSHPAPRDVMTAAAAKLG
ncbi:MAG TPA: shikimate 5-dehydrogenase [Alphaproteobacteria bacterium]|nr:shikimate 5-dehydrogenase [Rhodospirillaceae bacterium]HRJ13126.1 shikimate 5-dehydrogenase [Alphaproteobacteria bacterium]